MSEYIDNKTIGTIDGFDIEAHLVHDPDSEFEVADPLDEPIKAAWLRDEWHYVGTVITASKAGIELGSSAIWGQEYGLFPGHDDWLSPLDGEGENLANGYGPQLITEAIEAAKVKLAEINATDAEVSA